MTKFVNLHCHSTYSLLDGLSQPKDIVSKSVEYGYEAVSISDHGSISNCVELVKECKKKNIKPILGSELYICDDLNSKERKFAHLCVHAKNKNGWKKLIKLNAVANQNFYYKPRIDLLKLAEIVNASDIVAYSGHAGSQLFNCLFTDLKSVFNCKTIDECRQYLDPYHFEKAVALARLYELYFGKGNFYIEIQLIDRDRLPVAQLAANILREVSKYTGIKCVASADSHYVNKEDAILQRILIASALRTNFKKIKEKFDSNEEVGLGGFFKSNNYHIPSIEELIPLHTTEELENSVKIASECESYDILSTPLLPSFTCPGGVSETEYLRQLCRDGWRDLIKNKIPEIEHSRYKERIIHELSVVEKAGLSGYFLIVQDYVKAARSRGELASGNRGSAAGSLIAYLSGITTIDPIRYDLLFERFYNEGRNSAGNIKLPDIDCDFAKYKRENTIEYIREKYGRDSVAHICAFGRLMGRGALKEVLRAFAEVGFDEMNKITEYIPDEAKIADDLQTMKEEEGDSSIIKWALENNSKELSQWCRLEDDGSLSGELADKFELAIKLEGTKKSQSQHASAIIAAPHSLLENCPMVRSASSDDLIVGVDHKAAEAMGYAKFDILGITLLDKLAKVKELLITNKIKENIS